MTYPPIPLGAITETTAWGALPRHTSVYLINKHGEIITYRGGTLRDLIQPSIWNVGERSSRWPYDFAFTNYFHAHAYSLKRKADEESMRAAGRTTATVNSVAHP